MSAEKPKESCRKMTISEYRKTVGIKVINQKSGQKLGIVVFVFFTIFLLYFTFSLNCGCCCIFRPSLKWMKVPLLSLSRVPYVHIVDTQAP